MRGLVKFGLQVAAGFLAILAGYLILVLGFGGVINKAQPPVVVPEVVGRTLEESEAILGEKGLVLENAGETKDSSLPAGYIVSQDPEPGMNSRKGRSVKVRVSAGLGEVHMPNVTGRTLRQAEIVLSRMNLKVAEVTEVHDDTVPKDHIIDQTPKPHKKVKPGSKVTLLVSLGSEEAEILMPVNVVGMTVDEAARTLKEYDLGVGNVTQEPSLSVPEGRILRQNPDIGMNVKKGDRIDLVISSGLPPE